jgi:hypothetical protein
MRRSGIVAVALAAALAAPAAALAGPFDQDELAPMRLVPTSRALVASGWARDEAGRGAPRMQDWPAALRLSAGRLRLDVSPHAAAREQVTEAGALVRLGERVQDRLLDAVGVDEQLRSHWYLFAGASRRTVGLDPVRTNLQGRAVREDGDGLVRETQAGVGFRRGALRAAVGYTYERISVRNFGERARDDRRVGLTLSIR